MAGMPDQDQGPALGHIPLALIMDLGDQGAGGVEDGQAADGSLFLDAAGYAMGAEHGDRVRRHFRQVFDEDRTLVLQAFDHVLVVHDLVADIDRGTVFIERTLDYFDGTHDARAKSAGLRKIYFHGTLVTQVAPFADSADSPVSLRAAGHIGYVQYPHHDRNPQVSPPKHMEVQDYVSKKERLKRCN